MRAAARSALSTPPLCVLHEYDGSLQANVWLDAPLWVARATADKALQMLSVCSQLEAVSRRVQLLNVKGDNGQGPGLLQQEQDLTKRLDATVREHSNLSLKSFLCSHPLGQLFPRLLSRLDVGPVPSLDKRTAFENYLLHLSQVNQTLVLALQVREDARSSPNHKYVAYQLAMLYQSLSLHSPHLDTFKQEIERQFAAVKAAVRSRDGPARLPVDLREWLHALTSRLLQEISQLPDGLMSPIDPVLACLDPHE